MQKRGKWDIEIRMVLQFAATSKRENHYYLVYNIYNHFIYIYS